MCDEFIAERNIKSRIPSTIWMEPTISTPAFWHLIWYQIIKAYNFPLHSFCNVVFSNHFISTVTASPKKKYSNHRAISLQMLVSLSKACYTEVLVILKKNFSLFLWHHLQTTRSETLAQKDPEALWSLEEKHLGRSLILWFHWRTVWEDL